MDGWSVALGIFAFYLAIRTLTTLMKAHERKVRRELAIQSASTRRTATAAKPSETQSAR